MLRVSAAPLSRRVLHPSLTLRGPLVPQSDVRIPARLGDTQARSLQDSGFDAPTRSFAKPAISTPVEPRPRSDSESSAALRLRPPSLRHAFSLQFLRALLARPVLVRGSISRVPSSGVIALVSSAGGLLSDCVRKPDGSSDCAIVLNRYFFAQVDRRV